MNHTTDRLEFTLAPRAACIGVFDSGVGGLSILRALRERLPEAPMIYIGDVAHAPYGDRCANKVCERSQQVIEWLIDRGATMVVLACNTATVLAIEVLRLRWPSIIFVGVEPGVKPAAAQSRTRRIAVMATVATAVSKRLQQLIARHAPGVHVPMCRRAAASQTGSNGACCTAWSTPRRPWPNAALHFGIDLRGRVEPRRCCGCSALAPPARWRG